MGVVKEKVLQAKHWMKSTTIIAGILSVVGVAVKMFFDVDVMTVINTLFESAEGISENVDNIIFIVQQVILFIGVVFGRKNASAPIKPLF